MEYLVARTLTDKKIKEIINPSIIEMGYEIIRIQYSQKETATLQIMLDKDNSGIGIAEIAKMSTNISTLLDIDDPIENEYNLEISSPGINRPLTRKKDFDIWEGHSVKITTNELIDQRKNFSGVLRGVQDNEIILELSELTIGLNFDWIDEANLYVSFDEILKNAKYEKTKILNEDAFDEIETD